ncbi:MAG TPA: hypothetical protein VNM91_02215 [Dehalococcoidia bacterium]|nr:hypothetical protein [Dehalococcoidia bacterium]
MRISFDFDGVLCPTPFGRMAVHKPSPVAPLPDGYESLYDAKAPGGALRLLVERARFGWRRMSPEAAPLLRDLLAAGHEPIIVTGRSVAGRVLVESWLRREGLLEAVDVHMAPPGLRPAQHKLAVARMHGVEAHIDDDPRTAWHLVRNGVPRVFLLAHAGVPVEGGAPEGLVVVRSLGEFRAAVLG